MEMNTRLQVEHPVTEEITGQDLVEWQLRVASGEKLPLKQEELKINGHAIEARLYAEDPNTGFLPSTGKPAVCFLANADYGIRLESSLEATVPEGREVTPFYDPMIAKLVARGSRRHEAIARLRFGCAQTEIWPVKTNAGFLVRCLDDSRFQAGDVDTALVASRGDALTKRPDPSEAVLAEAAHGFAKRFGRISRGMDRSPWTRALGFRLNAAPAASVRMLCDGKPYIATPTENPAPGSRRPKFLDLYRLGRPLLVRFDGEIYAFELDTGEADGGEVAASDGAILSPMPGKIVSVAAKAGAKLKKGDPILVLEAMKMEHTLVAPFDGELAELNAKAGAQVSEGVVLAKMEKE
jgi:3-methylcrotonyl-CoA carboxylase alpha subunit